MALHPTLEKIKDWCLGTRTLAEAADGIERGITAQSVLKVWSKRMGKATIGLGVLALLTHAGFMITPAVIAGACYVGIKIAQYAVNKSIEEKREAAEEFIAAGNSNQTGAPSKQPAPKPGAKVTGAFNADAVRQAAPAPANTDTPKPKGLLKRFGIG